MTLKKIAIYSGFTFHLECIGFICELFTNNNYLIDIYYNNDNYGNIKFFTARTILNDTI